jgi:hypothetical protein
MMPEAKEEAKTSKPEHPIEPRVVSRIPLEESHSLIGERVKDTGVADFIKPIAKPVFPSSYDRKYRWMMPEAKEEAKTSKPEHPIEPRDWLRDRLDKIGNASILSQNAK